MLPRPRSPRCIGLARPRTLQHRAAAPAWPLRLRVDRVTGDGGEQATLAA
jgi:hypothetical protein